MAEHNAVRKSYGIHRWVLLFAPAAMIFAVVVIPFLELVSGNFNTRFLHEIVSNTPTGILTRRAIWNSFEQGIISAGTCFLFGFPLGLFLGRHSFRFRRLVNSFILLPFFLPSITVVFSILTGFGEHSLFQHIFHSGTFLTQGLPGIIAVNTFFNVPVVALFTMIAASQVDNTLYEATITLSASRFRAFRTVWGRNVVISALGGSLLAFIYSFAGFAAPLILGGPGYFTLDAWIYFMVRTLNDIPSAIVLALLEALILLVPALLYVIFVSRTTRVEGTPPPIQHRIKRRDIFYGLGVTYSTIWIVFEIYLLSSVFLSSFESKTGLPVGLSNYSVLFSSRVTNAIGISTGASIMNTIFYGTMVALLVVVFGLMWVYGYRRTRGRARILSEIPQYSPLIISAILMAFALSSAFEAVTPSGLLWLLIVIAQTTVAVPVVLRVLDSGFSTIPASYSEASTLLGGNPFFEVEMPLARTALTTSLMFGFAISLGEFSATNFLATGSFVPLTVEMYALQSVRLPGVAYAAASILLIISLVSFYLIQRMGERFVGVY